MRLRTVTALLTIPIFLIPLYLGGPAAQVLVFCLIALGLYEYGNMASGPIFWDYLLAAGLSFPLLLFFFDSLQGLLAWIVLQLLYYFSRSVFAGRSVPIAAAFQVLGVFYVAVLFSFFWLLRHTFGFWWLAYALLVTWVTDIGAYVIGTRIGRHKVAPTISPAKSWEGCIGGLVCAALAAGLYGLLGLIPLNVWSAAAFGGVLSLSGQIGDLVESAVKREAGVKDSGRLLPGHGGILDRFDSLLFVIPLLYLLLWAGLV